MDGALLSGWLASVGDQAARVTPVQYCQTVFVILATGVLAVNALPARTKRYLLDYGARENKSTGVLHDKTIGNAGGDAAKHPIGADTLEYVVATFASYSQVPHAWFSSFYIAYLVCAFGWTAQWLLWQQGASSGGFFAWLAEHQRTADRKSEPSATSMSLMQVSVAMGLEALQAARRLYEHASVFKASNSKMNFTHWALGLAFYVCMSVAVWIEGSPAGRGIEWAKLALGTSLFLFAWLQQYRCHGHLASLVKYSLPEEGMFRYLVCPHYTCECTLYLALSIVAAPAGQLFNQTLLPSVFFVVACLGVTANRTTKWYIEKFGAARVAKRWKMIPFIF
ncbi:3-oxo-5-alpha-steroid 4-dehydrogenase [Grosmannia clavigera kw1407]|uniref:Polyprenal reductase n=1 Tax=Grosmannia clavigera (strain kw1407 / UAMH 11150) TaxID=655863 RepID=F0XPS9_GROCL|nr:3-oxo-5-alpha-steroid 4-dehydrogenase [Grosmannia clavigera kw1407]EFX00617.1 3-oxo-5-alpha-steroid 4-dehydrogenase [Grosmannia clavigera kw1407]